MCSSVLKVPILQKKERKKEKMQTLRSVKAMAGVITLEIEQVLKVHTHTHSICSLQHSKGNLRTGIWHSVSRNICDECSSGLQSKYTPTLPAGLFVQPACYLDAGGVWWRWQGIVVIHYFFMSVNPVVCCYRKAPSLIESDSPRKAFLATFYHRRR